MINRQPSFHCVANYGDANPFDYGGIFLRVDRRGFSVPRLLFFNEWTKEDPRMTLHAVELEYCFEYDNNGNIQLGTNYRHRYLAEWFGKPDALKSIASCNGITVEGLRLKLCGDLDDRVEGYMAVVGCHGAQSFDDSPYVFGSKKDARKFCDSMLREIAESESWSDN